jgi:signal transduction histidine kinase
LDPATKRSSLFRKYALYFGGLVGLALAASGLISLYFAYGEARGIVDELQREKARGAALRIEQFARLIEGQLRGAFLLSAAGVRQDPEELQLELIRVLRQAPAVAEIVWVDESGRQQAKVSRTARDEIGPGRSFAEHPGVAAAERGQLHASAIYFRHDSEPFVSLAVGSRDASRRDARGPVLLAEVNLKLVWEIVAAIKIGQAGHAYVVDAAGRLISHPDIGLVLRMTDLSALAPVRNAIASHVAQRSDVSIARTSADGRARFTVTAWAPIPTLGWHVFVEQPLAEAFAPLIATTLRTSVLLVAGVLIAVMGALLLARRMTAPIRALQASATRIGEGRLEERVSVDTGDELQALGDQFNRMADRLRESYEGLEAKIAERTRQLDAANQAKSRFLAAASHDLRQPAHALGLFLAQLRGASTPEDRERLIERIEASSTAVSELLEALFDMSSLDAGKITPRPADFAVQTIFNRLEQHFAFAAQSKGLRLRIRPASLRVRADGVLLERVLLNLTANAIRYTREGSVLVACRQRRGVARIEVWDSGIGIPPGQRSEIFEEFYQAHGPVGEEAKGLGLGLAIVKRLVALMDLELELRSVVGRGSVFAVEVPLALAPEAAAASIEAPAAAMERTGLALVVDDDADARDAASGLLARWGWEVIAVADGRGALAAAGRPIDVIVSDYRLAGGELGTDVIAMVRNACAREVPAVVVSGERGDALPGLPAGVHWLQKPLQPARLRAALQHVSQPSPLGSTASNASALNPS